MGEIKSLLIRLGRAALDELEKASREPLPDATSKRDRVTIDATGKAAAKAAWLARQDGDWHQGIDLEFETYWNSVENGKVPPPKNPYCKCGAIVLDDFCGKCGRAAGA